MSSHLPAIFKFAGKQKNGIVCGKRWFYDTLTWFPQEWHKGFPGQGQHDTRITTEQLGESCWFPNLRRKDRDI